MTPNIQEFKGFAKDANVVPVYTEVLADMETPVSVFAKISSDRECFLLESAENIDNWGRFSFIACSPKAVFTLNGTSGKLEFKDGRIEEASCDGYSSLEPFAPLRNYIASRKVSKPEELPSFFGGAVGYFGYECVNLFERLPLPKGERVWDDARLALYDDIIIFDNLRHTAKLVACSHVDEFKTLEEAYADAEKRVGQLLEIFKSPRISSDVGDAKESPKIVLKSNIGRDAYIESVEKAKEYIKSGEIIQVVLSQKFTAHADVSPLAAYRALRLINPSPYMFCLRDAAGAYLVGSSPETLVRFCDGKAQVRPIAGTRKRGKSQSQDLQLAAELLADEKERAEHLMLVDLGRNDVSRFCRAGSVQVKDFMSLERYSHVMHMVSTVDGEVNAGTDAFDALAAVFPAGTLSGAPKVRAMEIINELEPERRGPYGGAAGYIGYGGNMDLAITIRTLQMREGSLCVQAGAGIVYDSNPEFEYEETKIKARAVAAAVEVSADIDTIFVDSIRK